MTPDVYDADGNTYDRRVAPRREDDLPERALQGYEFWAKLMLLHKGKLIALFTMLGSVSGYGLAFMSTPRDLQAVNHRVDTIAVHLARVEQNILEGAADRAGIKRTLGWVIYMQCKQTRRTDPTDLPPICSEPRQP